jgi:hypothetical protein
MRTRSDAGVGTVNKITSVGESQVWNNEQVLEEMQDFLRALESYPDRFASDVTITFEQHLQDLIPAAKAKSAAA